MTTLVHLTNGNNFNSAPDELIDIATVTPKGNAEPTSRVLDGSSDHGYAQEWVEDCTLADGRTGQIVYLFAEDDLMDDDGEPIEEAENLPFDDDHIHRIKLVD